jgi:hypothetical protein
VSPERQIPLKARLHRYLLTPSELALLTAMVEHCSDGSTIWAGFDRLSAYSKISYRNIRRLVKSLCKRGILTQLNPPSAKRNLPATYRLNEAAMHEDPAMTPYLGNQRTLPGIRRPSIPGEPIQSDGPEATMSPGLASDLRPPCPQPEATMSPGLRPPRPNPEAKVAPDSRSIDSINLDSKKGDSRPAPKQSDFDERDIRKLAEAWGEAEMRPDSLRNLSEKELHEWVAERAGVTIGRMVYLRKVQHAWPESSQPLQLLPQAPMCEVCDGQGQLRPIRDGPGPRLIPCPQCSPGGMR